MTDADIKDAQRKAARRERLGASLKENLKRRKELAKSRMDQDPAKAIDLKPNPQNTAVKNMPSKQG